MLLYDTPETYLSDLWETGMQSFITKKEKYASTMFHLRANMLQILIKIDIVIAASPRGNAQ